MAVEIDFYYDCSSPWTYLAFHAIGPLAEEMGVPVTYKPVLVGGIFNSVNPSVYQNRDNPVPAKQAYAKKDLADWARYFGLEIGQPTVFPVNAVKSMRGAFVAADAGKIVPYSRAVFEAYWGRDQDISQEDVLGPIVDSVGLDRAAFFAGIADQAIKDRLKASTDEAIQRGAFGSPSIFVGDDMFFGNDRLPLIRASITRQKAA